MYKIVDSRGVWVAQEFTEVLTVCSTFMTQQQAQNTAAVRNLSDGTGNEDGTYKTDFSKDDYKVWRKNHLQRKDCTCKKEVPAM